MHFARTVLCFGILTAVVCAADSQVFADTHYVSPTGGNIDPYTNWVTAAVSIQDAIDAAVDGDTVLVTNGTYVLTNQVSVTSGITLQSVNGPSATVVDGNASCRCFFIQHANAFVTGFTATNGYASGGGVQLANGTVANCWILENVANGSPGGGGAYITGGMLRNCLVVGNDATGYLYDGGGICMTAGSVVNCTITANYAMNMGHGGGIYGSGSVRNCVIWGNDAYRYVNTRGVTPTTSYIGDPLCVDQAGFDFRLQASSPCIDSGSNENWMLGTTDLGGDKRVAGGLVDIGAYEAPSPGFDFSPAWGNQPLELTFTASVTLTNMSNVHYLWDFDNDGTWDTEGTGLSVVTNTYIGFGVYTVSLLVTNDMGEYVSYIKTNCVTMNQTVFLSGAPVRGSNSLETVFTSTVNWTNTTGMLYSWDLDGNGTAETSGVDLVSVTNIYGPGLYTVSLTVSNAIGQIGVTTSNGYIYVDPSVLYVATNGNHIFPFVDWGNASTNIQAAVNAANYGDTVWVSNGTYSVTQQVSITKGLRVLGTGNPEEVIIDGCSTTRCVFIDNAEALLSAVTVQNGFFTSVSNTGGAGVYVQGGGTVSNCFIHSNVVTGLQVQGGGAYIGVGGATIVGCVISNNHSINSQGGGVALRDCYLGTGYGIVDGCTIIHNSSYDIGSGTLANDYDTGEISAIRIRNCVITQNRVTRPTFGAAAVVIVGTNAIIEDCIISYNISDHAPAGIDLQHGSIARRCEIFGNDSGAAGVTDPSRIENCLIYNNTGYTAIYAPGPAGFILNCTVVSNNAIGAALTYPGAAIINTILYANSGSDLMYGFLFDPDAVRSSLIGVINCGTNALPADPTNLIGSDPSLDTSNRLTQISPCLDAGMNMHAFLEPQIDLICRAEWSNSVYDLDGLVHGLDGDANGVGGWDIGAYEVVNDQADTDDDGLLDTNELATGTTSPLQWDTDGDRQGDGVELGAGTDPTDPSSYFGVSNSVINADTNVLVWWFSVAGKTYQIQESTDLVSAAWSIVQSNITDTAPINATTVTVDKAKAYYRVVVE